MAARRAVCSVGRTGPDRGPTPSGLDTEHQSTEADLITRMDRSAALDPLAVHEGPVGRAELVDLPAAGATTQLGVLSRDGLIGQRQVAGLVPADGDDVLPH